MNFRASYNILSFSIHKNWGMLLSLVAIIVLLLARVSSHKYSLDTTTIFLLFHSILFDQSTSIHYMGLGWVNSFNFHFNLIYILISPLYFLGPSLLIFSWKFICYGGFLAILWCLIDRDGRYEISDSHKNLFLILVALHPTFVANLISPDIWDSDLIMPLLGLAILHAARGKWLSSVFWFCLTFLVKEDMILVGILYGFLLVLLTRNIRYVWLSVVSLGWFWIVTHVVMPTFATSTEDLGLLRFSFGNLGSSMYEIILNSIIHPRLLVENGLWLRKFASLFIIFLCVSFLPFWKKRSLVYLLPGLVVIGYTMIAVQPYLDYSKHHMLAFFVFVVWSSFESYILLGNSTRTRLVLFSTLASLTVIVVLQMNLRVWSYYLSPANNFSTLETVKETYIPPGSSLLTGGIGSPWLCYGMKCFVAGAFEPDEIEKVEHDYILINLSTVFWETLSCKDETIAINLRKLNGSQEYELRYSSNDIVLLKKIRFEGRGKQGDWSGNLENYQQINHDCMKSNLMRNLRLY